MKTPIGVRARLNNISIGNGSIDGKGKFEENVGIADFSRRSA